MNNNVIASIDMLLLYSFLLHEKVWTRDIVTRSVFSIFEPDRWKNRCENRFWISFESNFKYLEPIRRSRPIFLGFDERIDEFIPSK